MLSVLIAGCYNPASHAGSACDPAIGCPDGLVCDPGTQTCLAGSLADAGRDAILIDGCTPGRELCGDGIDQDCDGIDPPCPDNDKAAGAIDVGAGGEFTVDLTYANDDTNKTGPFCGGDGGRDVYYKIHLDKDEAIYLDTFGSDFDSIVRVFHGACHDGGEPGNTQCHDDACGGVQTQAVWDLTAGDNCIVVDQSSSDDTTGSLTLHVERGRRSGEPIHLGDSVTGTTVGATDQSTGPCLNIPGPDVGYHFTECPGDSDTFVASTCNAVTAYDDVVYIRGPNGFLRCNDDDAACTAGVGNLNATTTPVTVGGPHMFWIIVDASDPGIAGAFQLDTIIQ